MFGNMFGGGSGGGESRFGGLFGKKPDDLPGQSQMSEQDRLVLDQNRLDEMKKRESIQKMIGGMTDGLAQIGQGIAGRYSGDFEAPKLSTDVDEKSIKLQEDIKRRQEALQKIMQGQNGQ